MKYISYLIIIVLLFSACENTRKSERFLIETKYGNIKLKLYENTPKHKSNFMVLVNKGFYDGLLFHRVIENFMVQGGDPLSEDAGSDERLGSGGPDYTVKAEIRPENIHKRGALAAARKPNSVNPERRSSGSQFYIVTGRVYTNKELDALEKQINTDRRSQIINMYIDERSGLREKLNEYQENRNFSAMDSVLRAISNEIKNDSIGLKEFKISPERRKIYTSIGGAPTLDDEYTVFGEVTEGMDVAEKISKLPTDENDRPLYDVKMKITQIR